MGQVSRRDDRGCPKKAGVAGSYPKHLLALPSSSRHWRSSQLGASAGYLDPMIDCLMPALRSALTQERQQVAVNALERLSGCLTVWHAMRMARGYSRDLRERLLQALASGLSAVEIARTTGVSLSSLRRWKQKQAAGVSLTPGVSPGGPRKISAADEPARRAQVAARPDATLVEHCARWAGDGHVPVSLSTLSRALDRLGLPLEKRP